MTPILYSFRRCPYAMRARLAITLSQTRVELREIILRDKPAAMLAASPKGTVPVLVIGDEVIEESLDIMKWALADHPLGALSDKDAELIALNDGPFKSALDRTKYATRFPGTDPNAEREKGCAFIATLEARLSGPWLGGDTASLVDYAILPFIRQFANTDATWFAEQPYPRVQKWLGDFLASPLFQSIMNKYERWDELSPSEPVYFPSNP
ncbi:glutathione S-transferase [Nereida ignava]|uniref:Glutaredoxin 2 n=1 Tax=Nereida ignava TaxID=282199 RepID=A0A0U1NK17_9RHOB|nr:glutathione S-transferase [Nereida ignava]CRK75057.1 glutaredoxin 2 [Nereida ignava]SFJ02792.1 Glutathione S-transferase [Nereida ignava DSM 16309]